MSGCPFSTRRGILRAGGAFAASVAAGPAAFAGPSRNPTTDTKADRIGLDAREPFYGPRQAGIQTKQQANLVFASFDVTTGDVRDLVALLQAWTAAAARLSAARPSPGRPTRPTIRHPIAARRWACRHDA